MAHQRFTQSDLMDLLEETAGLPAADRSTDPTATLGDVGLDSLAFLQLQAEMAQRHGVELPDDHAQATFGDVVAFVAARIGAQEVA
jgi:acyl carrier protein